MLKISNLINDVSNNAVNQFLVEYKGKVWFQSYDSIIAVKKADGSVIIADMWDYSKTTAKHLYMWLRNHTRYHVVSRDEVLNLIETKQIKLVKKLKYS